MVDRRGDPPGSRAAEKEAVMDVATNCRAARALPEAWRIKGRIGSASGRAVEHMR